MGSLGRQGRVGDGMLACCSADGSLARHAAVPRVAQPAWRAWAMGHDPSGSGVDGLAYARRHVPCCANRPASDGLGEALLQWEPGLGGGEGGHSRWANRAAGMAAAAVVAIDNVQQQQQQQQRPASSQPASNAAAQRCSSRHGGWDAASPSAGRPDSAPSSCLCACGQPGPVAHSSLPLSVCTVCGGAQVVVVVVALQGGGWWLTTASGAVQELLLLLLHCSSSRLEPSI